MHEMERIVPWAELVALIEANAPAHSASDGRHAFAVPVILRIHLLQQWFNMSQPRATEKDNQWYFGIHARLGVHGGSGLVRTVAGTATNVNDVMQAHALLPGQQTDVFADVGYRGVDKRQEARHQQPSVRWQVAMIPDKRRALPTDTP
jgi:IS5 family transposase